MGQRSTSALECIARAWFMGSLQDKESSRAAGRSWTNASGAACVVPSMGRRDVRVRLNLGAPAGGGSGLQHAYSSTQLGPDDSGYPDPVPRNEQWDAV